MLSYLAIACSVLWAVAGDSVGNEAFGIQWSFDGKFAVFVGGFPIVVDNEVIGGVGLSGGNGEQDTKAGVAALAALAALLEPRGMKVLVEADIKK